MAVSEREEEEDCKEQQSAYYGKEEAKSKLLEAAKLHVHIGLNTYLGINTCVPISSYKLSTLNSAANIVLEGNWCLDLPLYALAILGALSHRIDIGTIGFSHIGISCIKFLSHYAANATNSESIVEPVMHVCFLEAHEMAP
ncbi:hypothetical protein Tco_1009928 [Tanacetum coccineum]